MINSILNILYKNKTSNIKIIKKDYLYSKYIIITTCFSQKHIDKLTDEFINIFKNKYLLISGKKTEWLMLEIQDITIHIMLQNVRKTYNLESLYLKEYDIK